MSRCAILSAACIAIVTFSGCGSGNPKTARVTGTVTYQGKPVEGASVSFALESAPQFSTGVTDAQGKFTLTTFKSGDGALIGKNKVTITKVDGGGASGPNMKPEDYAKMIQGGGGPPKPKSLIPEIYGTNQSPLSADVSAGGKNDFPFTLEDAAPAP